AGPAPTPTAAPRPAPSPTAGTWAAGEGASWPTTLLAAPRPPQDGTSGRETSAEDAYNVTSPVDMAHLFEALLVGKVVSRRASAEMLDLLAQQQINDRLPALLPPGTRVAHKTGNLATVVHDAGVIYAPRGPIVVVVMSEDVQSEAAVVDAARKVARLAYDLLS
ncbi:MAG: serine hydrolase, partial [Thermomicrobiaceae bacterium]|nr:serine hydrolase [Thermomicrobiaceae bacterium]